MCAGERGASKAAAPPRELLPSLSAPKGGGAIRGIGETFHSDVAAGTGSLTIPLSVTPGRGGFTPELALRYESAAGNGPFGLGFALSMRSIARKTDKGLPRYIDDPDDSDDGFVADVFILSGAEDLVPARTSDSADAPLDVVDRGAYRVMRYRPRVEGAFTRIERWRHRVTGDTYWRALTRDNLLATYGSSPASRIADPDHPGHVFQWLLDEMRDDRGNVCRYLYKAEDGAGVSRGQLAEASRFNLGTGAFAATSQRYLKRVRYGNRVPIARDAPAPADDSPDAWLFEIVFDYGEHEFATPTPDEVRPWTVRTDPFSTFRATFEVRTYRRCERTLVFHRIPELSATPRLVKSTDFTYAESRVHAAVDATYDSGPLVALLREVTHAGYILGTNNTYERSILPPLTLGFSEPVVYDELQAIDRRAVAGIPQVDSARWVDLDGEGVPGLLVTTPRAWFYQPNRGDGHFAAPALEATLPSPAELDDSGLQLVDLDGSGKLDLVRHASSLAGYFERTHRRDWRPFVAFATVPQIDWSDPNLRFVDLDGDGLPDLLITDDDALRWYPSLGKSGYARANFVGKPHHDIEGPAVVFADGTETLHLADMSGDGLVDLVRVRQDEVCYWPNLGYGRFGKKIILEGAPHFDSYDRFEPARVRFGDIDGSGTSDLIYSAADGTRIWFNRSGNSLSPPLLVRSIPAIDAHSDLAVVDLLGHGTACLVWATALPAHAPQPIAYVNLLADGKPHLLTSFVNNLGSETRFTYAPSTRFYLDDQAAGKPWITRLAFPVHVIERIEHDDRVAGSSLVTRFAYHHGFYDGVEREFRGFALVEQWDAETFTAAAPENELVVPPIHTKTWFHTGAWLARERIEHALARDYFGGDPLAPVLSDTAVPAGLTTAEEREATRARRGHVLRREVYADDGTSAASQPYSVTTCRSEIKVLQRARGGTHAAFHTRDIETIALHYDRDPTDPRTQHEMALQIDDLGNLLLSCALAYPRRGPVSPDRTEQARLWAAIQERTVINHAAELDWYRIGVVSEETSSELTGFVIAPNAIATAASVRAAIAASTEIPYEATADGVSLQRRFTARTRSLFYRDDLSGPLALGVIESLTLPYETYRLAFTPGLVTSAFGALVDTTVLPEGGYVAMDSSWWMPSGHAIFDPARFYMAVESIDQFAQHRHVNYDPHSLIVASTTDALGNVVTADLDYRVLAPVLITDANGDRTAATYDGLGLPIAIARQGKSGSTDGDTLADPTTRIEYDLLRWQTSNGTQPAFVHTYAREQHGAANPRWQETYSYCDGSSREVMKKVQAEPDPATRAARWVGTGRTVFDNKGNPIKQYEPFFAATPDYESEASIVNQGVTPIVRYDPLGRVIRTDFPDGTLSRVVYTPWREETWDRNDCVSEGTWLGRMQAGTPAQQRAATLTLAHANTPNVAHSDTLGRAFLRIADAGASDLRNTRVALDIEGNTLASTDPRGIVVAVQTYDLLGRVIRSVMPDGGESRALADVSGRPIRTWSARGFRHRLVYDALRRPTHTFALPPGANAELLVERKVYGESLLAAAALAANARGRIVRTFDGAGAVTSTAYDFKGNLVSSTRTLASAYDTTVDWSALATLSDVTAIDAAATPLLSMLSSDTFTISVTYDALDRVTSRTTPDGSVTLPVYNEANLLERLDVRLRGAATPTPFVTNLDYDAHGKCTLFVRGNATTTTYTYDPETFRMTALRTTRDTSGFVLQDLAYTYDGVGNTVAAADAVAFGNSSVVADGLYEFDPLYQLTHATGREHPGQQPAAGSPDPLRVDHPEDFQTLRRYREDFTYDVAGNLTAMAHVPLDGSSGWTRQYSYASDSNRLLATSLPGDTPGTFSATYTHDEHGNMIAMPHLAELRWDHADQLADADLGGGGTVYFAYDGAGKRVRKATVHGGFVEERVYLGDFEVYRKRNAATGDISLERDTLHVVNGEARVAIVETKTIDTSQPAFTPTSRTRYQLSTALGSSVFELDETAGVITYEEYFAYGGTAFRAATSTTDVSAKRYRYTGLERDEETGFDYATARYYASWLGRWTAADPIALGGGSNQFQYCGNNPIDRADPAGTGWGDWFDPSNWCNPFSSDCEVLPVEVGKGVVKAGYHTVRDTGARIVDMSTMGFSALGKATGGWDVGYTEWSPEAKNYDPDKSYWSNAMTGVYNNTAGGIVNTAKGVVNGDPDAVGALIFTAIVAKAGGGEGNPTVSVPVPKLAFADTGIGAFGRVPAIVAGKAITVTVPVTQVATAGLTLMVAKGGGGGDKGSGSGKGSGRGPKGSPGSMAKSLGGEKPIPVGMNLSFGLTKFLERFTKAFDKAGDATVDAFEAYDAKYYKSLRFNDPSIIGDSVGQLGRAFIENGGRIKFNLEGLEPGQTGITTGELQAILKDPLLESNTDFYVGGKLLTGAELASKLKPWR